MKKYKFLVTAEVEVEAENVVIATRAMKKKQMGGIRVIGSCYKLWWPDHNRDWTSVKIEVGPSKIERLK
jgi:hypothetical protein